MGKRRATPNWRTVIVAALCTFLLTAPASTPAQAAELAGVTLPDFLKIDGRDASLVGVGLRKVFVVKVYVCGLYMESPTNVPVEVIEADMPKGMIIHFLYKLSPEKLRKEYRNKIEENSPERSDDLNRRIDEFIDMFTDPTQKGDEFIYTYIPGDGVTVSIAGEIKGTIPGDDFMKSLFKVWFGEKPFDKKMKKELLGLK